MYGESSRAGRRAPRSLLELALSLVLALTAGGGAAWVATPLVIDTKLAWIRADLANLDRRIDALERRDTTVVGFQAQIAERVESVRTEVSTMRLDAAEIRRRLEELRWGRR